MNVIVQCVCSVERWQLPIIIGTSTPLRSKSPQGIGFPYRYIDTQATTIEGWCLKNHKGHKGNMCHASQHWCLTTLVCHAPINAGCLPACPRAGVDGTGVAVDELLVDDQWGVEGDAGLTQQHKEMVEGILCVHVYTQGCSGGATQKPTPKNCTHTHTCRACCSRRRVASTRLVPPQLVGTRWSSGRCSPPSWASGSKGNSGPVCWRTLNKYCRLVANVLAAVASKQADMIRFAAAAYCAFA